jgi:succinoglycan biosynthesis transport protein ExoP
LRRSRNLPVLASDHPPAPRPVPLLPSQYVQSPISIAQVLAILRAHRRKALFIALALLTATVVIVKLLPKSYTAQATVLVNFEGSDGNRQVPPDVFAGYLVTQVELLQSRDVVMTAIDRLGLTQDPEFADGFKSNGINSIRDWVAKQLHGNLTVEQGKGSQLLYVSMTSKDRNKAAQIVNAVVEAYQARQSNHSDDPSSGRAHEYSEELTDLKAKLSAAEDHMAQFRQRTGITDISAQNDVETQALSALEQQLLAAQNTRRSAESKSGGDQSSSDTVMASQLVQNLKNQLSTLQAELAQASSTLGPRHPKVLELQSQIAAAHRSLDHEIQSFSQNNSGGVASAAQLEDKLRHAVDEQHTKLLKIREMQDEGQKIQLELESAQTVYKRALDGYDQIMFASSSIVSRATPPLEASKPNKIVLLGLGALMAALFGLLGPLFYELWFNRRLHCRDDIERDLGLPVLAELDRIPGQLRFA